jgi:hypothetical protein
MKKVKPLFFLLLGSLSTLPNFVSAWGKEGHGMVAEVAFHYLDDSTKARVLRNLGNLSIEEAATWMDDMRSNSYYDYMRTWHYINVEKGQTYAPADTERDVLVILNSAVHELLNRNSLKKRNVKEDLYLLFHLVGDLHQPLHVGYGVDKGGNTIDVSVLSKHRRTNLHKLWDSEIIEVKKIKLEDCLAQRDSLSAEDVAENQKIDILGWMNRSRGYLDAVYDFQDGFIDQSYVDKNAVVIEKQILCAGLRLATVLKTAFKD